ncbi:3D domain-containing protein [Winogradskyella helgolandensis]|uniref:3D domain-containing protein n=1 Tax=Winogradskyella helgolandensis TaxID=2697010 RepID=UPI0015CEBC21|nr:3D domain-containing protein [Winogradskyella helgolandensis]
MKLSHYVIALGCISLSNCSNHTKDNCIKNTFQVTATAYNSLAYQTNSNPNITAFGDSLKPGLRYIAVSRDLLDSGLIHNTKVKIQGFDSLFTVKDKMNRRYRKRIDIYMDNDVIKAIKWGKKKVVIEYCIQPKDSITN